MNSKEILILRNNEDLLDKASAWFSEKWNIPQEVYTESILSSMEERIGLPQWYIVLDENSNIIAGTGVIQNDFHPRKDLEPNLCALFVEEAYRNTNMAKNLLNFVRKDFKNLGFEKLYLLTEHETFYEKCDWKFLTSIKDDEDYNMRVYEAYL